MACQSLIHTVVDYFLSQVVRAASVCIHTRALAHRIQTAQYFNGIGVVLLLAHRLDVTPREGKFVPIAYGFAAKDQRLIEVPAPKAGLRCVLKAISNLPC